MHNFVHISGSDKEVYSHDRSYDYDQNGLFGSNTSKAQPFSASC